MNDSTGLLTPRRYRSGAIVIDPVQRQVLVDGEPARLGSRAFDLLMTLLERRDRVVSKRELLDLVWPRLVVEENNLQVHVAALRKGLGPEAIATIPGRGYQFALPMDALEPAGRRRWQRPRRQHGPRVPGNLPPSSGAADRARCRHRGGRGACCARTRVVSIVGAGGIGKTRLALAVASIGRRASFPTGAGGSSWRR